MLRTSLRIPDQPGRVQSVQFLSSNAQDFIEEPATCRAISWRAGFLSSNAQDFIEDRTGTPSSTTKASFLSSNAQDFIEEGLEACHEPA